MMLDRLESDNRVANAAMIGRLFRIDPVMVLQADYFDWQVRRACANIVAEEERKAAEKAKPKSPSVH